MKIAIPSKGRLHEPAMKLLRDAGLEPGHAGSRALRLHCRNAPIEILLVRSDDIPEYVQDGVVDCGITGADQVREHGANVSELLKLGFGECTLDVAVPEESNLTAIEDVQRLRVATSYPRITLAALSRLGIEVSLVPITGSVEVAPRLGVADAIVDLVSSGNTLQMNGLRSLGSLFSSQALLIGNGDGDGGEGPGGTLAPVLSSVVQARAARYLMLNAPEASLDEITALVPGSRSPSLLPLAEPGMVAVHAVIPSTDAWSVLPRLRALGASDILLIPIERMLA